MNAYSDWLPQVTYDYSMRLAMLGAFKGLEKLQQAMIVGALLVLALIAFEGWLYFHDRATAIETKGKVIDDINEQTGKNQSQDTKRVNDASAVVGAVPDCLKLGSVYGTGKGECAREQDALENNLYKAPVAKRTQLERVGSYDLTVDRLPLPVGGVFSGEPEDRGVQGEGWCYPEKVSDKFGLPVWLLVDGLLVQKTVEVCR